MEYEMGFEIFLSGLLAMEANQVRERFILAS